MEELNKLIKTGAFTKEEVSVVALTFLIPKKDGSMRLIHDLRETNKHINLPRFTLHGNRDAAQVTRNSEYIAVLDLKHGYQQGGNEACCKKVFGRKVW